jgi:putative phage-type endonuclease
MPVLVDVVPGSGEWLAARRAGVTATDIVTILGLSTHDSVYSLFWRKLGQVPDEPDRDRWALGRHMEPYIVEKWRAEHPLFTDRESELFRSDDRPWQLATPDRTVWSHAWPKSAPLECKSWADADRKSWEGGPPPAVRAQLVQQMDVLDSSIGYWAVLFLPSGRFAFGEIEHDGSYIPDGPEVDHPCPVCQDIKLIRDAGEEFYRRLTFVLPPPDPDSSAATLAALRARFTRAEGKQAEVDQGLIDEWTARKAARNAWDELVQESEIAIRVQAGEAQILTVDGEPVARRIVVDAQVKAHTRHQDYYRRTKTKDEDNGTES